MDWLDWFKRKFTGKLGQPRVSWENLWFPLGFPLNQSFGSGKTVENCTTMIRSEALAPWGPRPARSTWVVGRRSDAPKGTNTSTRCAPSWSRHPPRAATLSLQLLGQFDVPVFHLYFFSVSLSLHFFSVSECI